MEIQRVGGTFGSVQVNYTTLSPAQTYPYLPTAVPRANLSDYQMTAGSVTFRAQQEKGYFDLQILDDTEPEEDEAIYVIITGVVLTEAAQIRPGASSILLSSLQMDINKYCIFNCCYKENIGHHETCP